MKRQFLSRGGFAKMLNAESPFIEQRLFVEGGGGGTDETVATIKAIGDKVDAFKTENTALKAELETQKTTIAGLKTEVNEAKEKANQAMEKSPNGMPLGAIEDAVKGFITENIDKIKEIKAQKSGFIEFSITEKAVGALTAGNATLTGAGDTGTTGSATNPDGIPELVGVQLAPPQKVNMRATIINSLVNSFNTALAAYPYTESVPKDGDANFTAELAAYNEIDFSIKTRYAEPSKLTVYEIFSDESVIDIPGLVSIATGFMKDKHDIRKQRGLLFGDGNSPNPTGVTTYGRLFNVGSMANSVRFVNFMDIVNAIITDVFTTHNFQDEMPYQPSLCLINPIDFYENLVSAKDEIGRPLYPQAGLFNVVTIGGVTILPDEMIPAGKIFVGDMSKYNVSNYVGYTVKIGFINDNLIKGQFAMVAYSRFHAFVKFLDKQAFVYDTIATVKAAISATV